MNDIDYLGICFFIYAVFDLISFCKQSDRISKLEWELRELKKRKDGAGNE
jgi:hypothetical protein